MKRLSFYLLYAARNLWRNRRWSSFAIFSIAAGVAAVVALRSLGLAIGDSLTDNVRGNNKGDLFISSTFSSGIGAAFDPNDNNFVFSERQIDTVEEWTRERGGTLTSYTFSSGSQVTALDAQTVGRPQFVDLFFIDPATYPITQDIFAIEPAGVPLGELFQGGNEVVISQNLAESQNIEVGERVRVSGTEEEFVVRGIVPTESEAGLRQFLAGDFFSVFFGFAYFNRDLAGSVIPVDEEPNRMNVNLPEGTSLTEIENAAREIDRLLSRSGGTIRVDSVLELLEENQFIADVLGRLIVSMGLGAMLIGGVGIINTMLVMVRRRTEEIAALKTFGLKGRQVALLFLAEAFWLGLLGSLLGGVFGVLLSGLANSYGAAFIQQPLRWRFYPEAVLFGLMLGLIVSMIFGVLPVITAARVRPAIILRPNENHIPVAGIIQSILALLFVVLSLGIIAGQILGNTLFGVIGVAVSLAILGILVLLLWVVVWLVGKLPAFGWVDFKLALRNLSTRRLRTATTLLALSAGMFALSSIAFFGAGVRDILNFTLTETLGGNVLVFAVLPTNIANPIIDRQLNNLEGVEYTTRINTYSGMITDINGETVQEQISPQEEARLQREIQEAYQAQDYERVEELIDQLPQNQYVTIVSRDTTNPNPSTEGLIAGRPITLEDRGKQVAVVRLTEELQGFNLQVGSEITLDIQNFRSGGQQVLTFEVVGILEPLDTGNLQAQSLNGDFQVPPESIPAGQNSFPLTLAQVRQENMNEVLLGLTSIPLIYALDISFFDNILSRLIQQFSALPVLVGLLSLGAAAVIMANTVALATLERRRQIGILKAIGLKGNRVLGVMLLENVFVSLLGGILGIGLSGLGVLIMTQLGLQEAQLIPNDALPVAIALIASAVGIGAVATLLSASVAVRERVLNVLRYE
jgi:putative ABC transport system permease protein